MVQITVSASAGILLTFVHHALATSWHDWWTYDGFSGPDFWGLVNPDWKMCAKGRSQSPINIDPKALLYDPNLKSIYIDKTAVEGTLVNTGQRLVFFLHDDLSYASKASIFISGGPLGAYQYKLSELHVHFGEANDAGSEHSIDSQKFPAEIQALAYNVDLFSNFSEAMKRPNGIAAISILIWVGRTTSVELQKFTRAAPHVMYKGQKSLLSSFSLVHLLPATQQYVTYEGSLTYPGCYETVTWILMNKPIYISENELQHWRDIHQSEIKQQTPIYMANNNRPLRDLNKRLIRTNINFQTKGAKCPTTYKDMAYTGKRYTLAHARTHGGNSLERTTVIYDDRNSQQRSHSAQIDLASQNADLKQNNMKLT